MRSGEAGGGEESWLEPDFVFIPLGPSPGQELKSYRKASSGEAGGGSLLPEALPPWPLANPPQAGNKPPPLPLPPPAGFAVHHGKRAMDTALFLPASSSVGHTCCTNTEMQEDGWAFSARERVLRKMGDKK